MRAAETTQLFLVGEHAPRVCATGLLRGHPRLYHLSQCWAARPPLANGTTDRCLSYSTTARCSQHTCCADRGAAPCSHEKFCSRYHTESPHGPSPALPCFSPAPQNPRLTLRRAAPSRSSATRRDKVRKSETCSACLFDSFLFDYTFTTFGAWGLGLLVLNSGLLLGRGGAAQRPLSIIGLLRPSAAEHSRCLGHGQDRGSCRASCTRYRETTR